MPYQNRLSEEILMVPLLAKWTFPWAMKSLARSRTRPESARRVDDSRMVRIEVFSEDKIAHTLVLRSTDDFDARFTTWLQEAYNLGG